MYRTEQEKRAAVLERSGMERKIEDIIDTYGDLLYRTGLMMLGEPQDVQDLLQEVMLKYMQKAPDFRDSEHEKAWLLRVTTNLCKDMLRFRRRHQYLRIEDLNTEEPDTAAAGLLLLITASMTAHAVYVNKHLKVFFEKDLTMEQMCEIERELEQMDGVISCRYVDGDTAWKAFGETYLTPELLEGFAENPLAESSNFKVGVSLNTDAEQLKEIIGELDGVRRVTGLWEE